MTPATTIPPDTASPADVAADNPSRVRSVPNTFREIIAIFRRSPEWIVIVFAWFAAGFLPIYWFMGEEHWWTELDSPLLLQPLVPFVIAALLWHDRERLQRAWNQTSRSKRHGAAWILWLGCILVMAGHFVHVLTYAAAGLIIAAVGIAYLAYGKQVTLQAARSFVFGILFIPPPASVIVTITSKYGEFLFKNLTRVLQILHKPVSLSIQGFVSFMDVAGHTIEIPHKQASAILYTMFCLLVLSFWRREKIGPALVTMAAGALFTAILTFLIPFFVLLMPLTSITDSLVRFSPLLLAAFSVTMVFLVKRRIRVLEAKLASSTRAIEKLSEQAQKATERATAGVTSSVSGNTRRAGRGVNKGTEAIIDGFVRFVTKPFKRKRRNRW